MKNLTGKIAGAVLIFVLVGAGCGGPTTTTNVNANANANSNLNANSYKSLSNTTMTTDSEYRVSDESKAACDENLTVGQRKQKVGDELRRLINEDDKDDQLGVQYNTGHFFEYALKEEPGQNGQDYLDLYIAGQVSTSNRNQDQLKHLQNFVRGMMKKRCIEGVVLLPKGTTIPLAVTSLNRNSGFAWFYCEAPTNPCTDGSCSVNCKKLGKATDSVDGNTPAASSNAASNTTANSGANKAP
jgi:hypothetical protein